MYLQEKRYLKRCFFVFKKKCCKCGRYFALEFGGIHRATEESYRVSIGDPFYYCHKCAAARFKEEKIKKLYASGKLL